MTTTNDEQLTPDVIDDVIDDVTEPDETDDGQDVPIGRWVAGTAAFRYAWLDYLDQGIW